MLYYLFFVLIHLEMFALGGLALGILLFLTSWKAFGRKLLIIAAIPLIVIGLTPIPRYVLHTLEQRFPVLPLPEHVDGLILLGGYFSIPETDSRDFPVYNKAASRLFDFMLLMRQYPQAKVLFTGTAMEARFTRDVMKQHGLDVTRIIFDSDARNTRDHAKNLMELVQVNPEEKWLLVTSAFHMPRAVGVFRGANWNIIPYPVDYHTPSTIHFMHNSFLLDHHNFVAWFISAKEWAGLINNRRDGLSTEFFPAPR